MKVTTVSAQVRFSKDSGGAWKSLEIGAEATLDANDRWPDALATLYADLGQQLKALWASNGNGQKLQNGHGEAESHREPPQQAGKSQGQQVRDIHYCQEHRTGFKQHGENGQVWYSHKAPGGKWCREKALAPSPRGK